LDQQPTLKPVEEKKNETQELETHQSATLCWVDRMEIENVRNSRIKMSRNEKKNKNSLLVAFFIDSTHVALTLDILYYFIFFNIP
jgi:hypothetical protein